MPWKPSHSVETSVGAIQTLTASWSTVTLVQALFSSGPIRLTWSLLLAGLLLPGIAGIAGLLLLRRSFLGWPVTIGIQIPQVLHLTIGSIAYSMATGFEVSIGHSRSWTYFVGLSSTLSVLRSATDPSFAVAVNLWSLLLVFLGFRAIVAEPLLGGASAQQSG